MPLSLSQHQIGRGWREVYDQEPLTTLTQSFLPDKGVWVDASFLTKDGYINRGRMNYRRPVSWVACLVAVWMALPKLVRRYVLRKRF